MDIPIAGVEPGSPARRAGIRTGDRLLDIDGQPVTDFIDYRYLTDGKRVTLRTRRGKREQTIVIEKEAGQPLGLTLDAELYPAERQCVNRCVFCFVDQLPRGLRSTLYVKDDDWRYSMLFGNYVTLTNLSDRELARIVSRRVSPLYISVHATDGALRAAMMGNPAAARIMDQLRALARGGIVFHCQVVLCPGVNDGAMLDRTMADLRALYPAARSVAVVPLGLTRHRDGLPALAPVGAADAQRAVAQVEALADRYLRESGERFAYASDELYQRAGLPWPRYRGASPVHQMSNGVGMMDEFMTGFEDALGDAPSRIASPRRVTVVSGMSAAPTIASLCAMLEERTQGLSVRVRAIENRFFGPSVTVAGLLAGADIADSLRNTNVGDMLFVPASSLREEDALFLDGASLDWLERELGAPIVPACEDGYAFVELLLGEYGRE